MSSIKGLTVTGICRDCGQPTNRKGALYCLRCAAIRAYERERAKYDKTAMKLRTCTVCGKEELMVKRQIKCRECSIQVWMTILAEKNEKRKRRAEKPKIIEPKPKKRGRKKTTPLGEIAAEARAAGMSYGQYLVWLNTKEEIKCKKKEFAVRQAEERLAAAKRAHGG